MLIVIFPAENSVVFITMEFSNFTCFCFGTGKQQESDVIIFSLKHFNWNIFQRNYFAPDFNPWIKIFLAKNNPGFNEFPQLILFSFISFRKSLNQPENKILDDLLRKLEIEHVAWYNDKTGNYFQIIFPTTSGEPCETTLHCLVELGIGKKYNSSVR